MLKKELFFNSFFFSTKNFELKNLGFKVIPSQANFLFVSPPDGDAEGLFKTLREESIIVRYFPGEVTGKYLRITVGSGSENIRLIRFLKNIYGNE